MQLAQTVHAVAAVAVNYPAEFRNWYCRSNNVVVLAAVDETDLAGWIADGRSSGLACALFREPDLDGELTAVAFVPDPAVGRFLSNLPLAGRETAAG